jgi:hypothetical protein
VPRARRRPVRGDRDGRASVVTDRIETFTETGIRLESGEELEADIVVTATGLNLLALGGIELAVDGEPVELPETVAYKGMMLSGVPNFAFAIGYTNASWTLKCDLTSAEYVCRLLNHMDEHGNGLPHLAAPRRVRVDGGGYLPDLLGVRVGEQCDKAGFPAVEVLVKGAPRRPRPPHNVGDRRAWVPVLGNALLQGVEEALAEVALVLVGASLRRLGCRHCMPLISLASYGDGGDGRSIDVLNITRRRRRGLVQSRFGR